jgi:hypothetical protein
VTRNSWSGTASWPKRYVARFPAQQATASRVAVVLTILTFTGVWTRRVITACLVLAALGLGVVIAVAVHFVSGWQLYAELPLVVLIIGVLLGLAPNEQLRAMYEPGSIGEIMVKDGKFFARLNGNVYVYEVADVRVIRKFGSMSAIVFRPLRAIVIPARWVPHHIPKSQQEVAPS